jgi:hypothetical protein
VALQRRTLAQSAEATADPSLHTPAPDVIADVQRIIDDALLDVRRNVAPPFEPHHVQSMTDLVGNVVDVLLDW